MRKLIVLDLSSADIPLFETYERAVLPLLGKYKGTLETCVRSDDGTTETHIIHFQDSECFEQFLAAPERLAMKEQWLQTGATSTITDIVQIDYFC